MNMHFSKITLLKKKKEPAGDSARNLPPNLKSRAKPKYTAPPVDESITYQTATTGTEEQVMADPYFLQVAFKHKTIPGKWTDYKITNVEHLKYIGETVFDKPHEKVTEHLKEYERYQQSKPSELSITENDKPSEKQSWFPGINYQPAATHERNEPEKPAFSFPPAKFSQ